MDPLETAATDAGAAQPSTPASASTPVAPVVDVEKLVNSARLEAKREAQASKDRELARLHKQHQAELKAIKDQAVYRMKQAGDQNADSWEEQVQIVQDAQQYRAIKAETEKYQADLAAWEARVAGVAGAYKLDPTDTRIANAASADDLMAKAQKAFTEDVEKERVRLLGEAANARRQAADAKVASGELDTLGGTPGATTLSRTQKAEQAKAELKTLLAKPGRKDLGKLEKLKADILAG